MIRAALSSRLHLSFLLILVLMLVSSPACKSKKKLLAEQQARELAEQTARTDRAISELKALKVNNALDPDEKERRLFALKDRYGDLKDPMVLSLFEQIAADIAKARTNAKAADQLAKEEAAAAAKEKAELEARKPRLSTSFAGIAGASTRGEANAKIQETLSLFASPTVPVLIVINESNGIVDYDKPTTIANYLNYLKDTGANNNSIKNVELNSAGKIIELELIKNN